MDAATDAEVCRYYELDIRINTKKYIEHLPTDPRYTHNGCPRTELASRMESFIIWNDSWKKNEFRQRVKQELPELEFTFQRMKAHYSAEKAQNEDIEFGSYRALLKSSLQRLEQIKEKEKMDQFFKRKAKIREEQMDQIIKRRAKIRLENEKMVIFKWKAKIRLENEKMDQIFKRKAKIRLEQDKEKEKMDREYQIFKRKSLSSSSSLATFDLLES